MKQLNLPSEMSGIAEAISAAGSQEALATAVGVRQQAVSQWLAEGYVPLCRASTIETLYGIPKKRLVRPKYLVQHPGPTPAVNTDL